MAIASNFIQHGEGIFGHSTEAFGAIISSVSYSWSANGNAELTNQQGLLVGKTYYDSRCEISFEAYMKKDGTTIPRIGEIIDIDSDVLNLAIAEDDEEIPANITKAIVESVDVKMESAAYRSFSVKAIYSPNIAALNPTA